MAVKREKHTATPIKPRALPAMLTLKNRAPTR